MTMHLVLSESYIFGMSFKVSKEPSQTLKKKLYEVGQANIT